MCVCVCVCVCVLGTVGNYCPGVGVDILCFREMCVWIKKVGNMARVWDSEELGNRTRKTLYILYTVNLLCHTVHLMKSLDEWNTTSKATSIAYCCTYSNMSIVVLCVQAQNTTSVLLGKCVILYLKLLKFVNFMVTRANALAIG